MNLNAPVKLPMFTEDNQLTTVWLQFFTNIAKILSAGNTVTVVTAKLTPTGSQGMMVFVNGVLISETAAT